MTTTLWSPQQQDAFTYARVLHGQSMLIRAVAGAGKTTTLVELVDQILAGAALTGRKVFIVFCAYNRAIVEEISKRIGTRQGVKVATFHGLGRAAWTRAAEKSELDEKKMERIVGEDGLNLPEEYHSFILSAVSLAKAHAFGCDGQARIEDFTAWQRLVDHFELDEKLADVDPRTPAPLEQAIQYAIQTLRQSIAENYTTIDFDDMLYAPLYHNARFWQNDWVLVDEAQDTNPARRLMARRILKSSGRLVAVGDDRQAIYGFTGADADAFQRIKSEFNCKELPLTTTYRCPKAVVRFAQQWVNHIEAADSAPEGAVSSIGEAGFFSSASLTLRPEDAVLCRNMAPLAEVAYKLIRLGIPCHVEGRDIGKGLVALATRWKLKSLRALADRLETYKVREMEKHLEKKQAAKAASVEDRVNTLLCLIQGLGADATIETLREQITKLFADTVPGGRVTNVTLATVHKAKGREWNRVYLWDRKRLMPSKYAKQEWQIEQEHNLCYVAATRAKQELIEVVI